MTVRRYWVENWARVESVLAAHSGVVFSLWATSVAASAANFVALAIVVATASQQDFAAYVLGLSILSLSGNWSDAGVSMTIGVMASQRGDEAETVALYNGLAKKHGRVRMFVGLTATCLLSIAMVLWHRAGTPGWGNGAWLLIAFALLGPFQARNAQDSALLYASGSFNVYGGTLVLAPAVRAILVVIAARLNALTLPALFWISAVATVVGFLFAAVSTAMLQARLNRFHPKNLERSPARAEFERFLSANTAGCVVSGLTDNLALVGSSLFASPAPIATFGVFQRLNQLVVTVFKSVAPYWSRYSWINRTLVSRHVFEARYVAITSLAIVASSAALYSVYVVAQQRFTHYSLGHPLEFAIALTGTGVGLLYVVMDSVLAGRGIAKQRAVLPLTALVLHISLLMILRPTTLLQMTVIGMATLVPGTAYSFWLWWRHRNETTIFTNQIRSEAVLR